MRKTQALTITEEGRDKGKVFLLTEMPADQAERWALRALLALTNSGAELPDGAAEAGMAGLAAAGIQALGQLKFETVTPLLDEMWGCVQYQPPPTSAGSQLPPQHILPGDASQIEEVRTRLKIRMALLTLHTGFSLPEVPRTSGSRASATA